MLKKVVPQPNTIPTRLFHILLFLLDELISRFRRGYRFLISQDRILVLFLILLVAITRIPWLLFIATDDPGDDSAFYLNIGKNLAEGNGYTTDFKENFYEHDGTDNNSDIGDQAFMIPPVYPVVLSLGFQFSYSALSAKVLQTILFVVFICVFYKFVEQMFSKKTAFFSAILIVFDPLFFQISVQPMTDIMSLILIISTFSFMLRFERTEDQRYICYAGILSALAALTREPNLVLFLLISGILFYRKKYRSVTLFALSFFIVLLPWYWYQYINTGYLFPRLNVTAYFPVSPIGSPVEKNMLLQILRENYTMIVHDYFRSGTFVLFLPFLIIGVLKNILKPKTNYVYAFLFGILIASLFSIVYVGRGGNANYRYFFPAYIIFLPLGLNIFFGYVDFIAKQLKVNKLQLTIDKDVILILFVSFSVLLSAASIGMSAYEIKKSGYDDNESYDWLNENAKENDLIASTNPQRCTYFTDLTCVRLPRNVDDFYLDYFISFYNITYLHLDKIYEPSFFISCNWVTEVFNETQEFSLTNYNFSLVHTFEKSSANVFIYEVNLKMTDE